MRGSERGLVKRGKELDCSVTAVGTTAGFWAVWVLVYVLKQPLRCADVGKGEAETSQVLLSPGRAVTAARRSDEPKSPLLGSSGRQKHQDL